MSGICLCMIVRDEATTIVDALDSVLEHIDSWLIVDTGSRDDTREVVRAYFAEAALPGQLVERPWVDFGHNRTEALELCRPHGPYAWMHDADDVLVGVPDLRNLVAPAYAVRVRYADGAYENWLPVLLRTDLPWRYEGVVGERLIGDAGLIVERVPGDCHVRTGTTGVRSRRRNLAQHDRSLLEVELDANPSSRRTLFNLARSCAQAGDRVAAVHYYERRSRLGGDPEEVFLSLLERARSLSFLGHPPSTVQGALLEAWENRPSRAEPLLDLASRLRSTGDNHLAALFAERALGIPYPAEDSLHIEPAAYGWGTLDELAIARSATGDLLSSIDLAVKAQAMPDVPPGHRERIRANVRRLIERVEPDDRCESGPVVSGAGDDKAGITLTLIASRSTESATSALRSIESRCSDAGTIDRVVVITTPEAKVDAQELRAHFPGIELATSPTSRRHDVVRYAASLVETPWWFHFDDAWRVIARRPLVRSSIDHLEATAGLAQVVFNSDFGDRTDEHDENEGRNGRFRQRVFLGSIEPADDGAGGVREPLILDLPSICRIDSIIRHATVPTRSDAARLQSGYTYALAQDTACRLLAPPRGDAGNPVDAQAEPGAVVGEDLDGQRNIQIEVLNLARRPDRWRAFLQSLASSGASPDAVHRRAAIDGLDLEPSEAIVDLFRANSFGNRRSVIAQFLSHVAVWGDAANRVGPTLVLEDDARVSPEIWTELSWCLDEADDVVPDWDLTFLGYHRKDRSAAESQPSTVRLTQPFRWSRFSSGTFAYVLSPNGAVRLIELLSAHGAQDPVHVFLTRHASELAVAEIRPPLAEAPIAGPLSNIDSDIAYDLQPLWDL